MRFNYRFLLILACLTLSAQSLAEDASRFISSDEIARADGKFQFAVKGVGSVTIHSVVSKKEKARSCLIDRASLEQEITHAFRSTNRNDVNGDTTVEVKLKGVMQGDQMVCSAGGSNCTVLVTIPDCSYDPDSAELPCSR